MEKPNKQFKKYIRELADYVRTLLFQGEYEMSIAYMSENENRNNRNNNRFLKYAEIEIDFTYLTFTINIYPLVENLWKKKDGWGIANIITHEMCHLLTEPLYHLAVPTISNATVDVLEEVRERQTQRITNTIMRFIPKDKYKIK